MCGIAGFQGEFEFGLLDSMNAALAHRGPDGAGAQLLPIDGQPPTGLGHRRLAHISGPSNLRLARERLGLGRQLHSTDPDQPRDIRHHSDDAIDCERSH